MTMELTKPNRIKLRGLSACFLLIALMLFSSCTIVNAIQAQTGAPLTQKLNPSKAALNTTSSCSFQDQVWFTIASDKDGPQRSHDFLLAPSNLTQVFHPLLYFRQTLVNYDWLVVGKTPIYILYKRLKIWA